MNKRTLALSFIATVSAAGGCREPEPVHANPPPMKYCKEKKVGDRCSAGDECFIPDHEHECGLNGYNCRDGKWTEMMTFCNPPPQDVH